MPSFDIVSRTDLQEVDNALNSTRREIETRYDFKGSKCEVSREDEVITILADDNYKLEQIQQMFKGHFVKRSLDPKALDFQKVEQASGNALRQKVKIKQGVESEIAKKLPRRLKTAK